MGHVEALTKYVTHFVDQLVFSGLEHVVISPGSRSTPLAMTFAEHSGVTHWVHLDERSAAFFALGIAKQEQKPVALVCTSGTAAANYYPAIVEAYYSRVPLVVLTADRPHELREVGAPQSINQIRMFGTYTKWEQDLALPEEENYLYARRQAARAIEESASGHHGPVHLNFPLREPLIPDFQLKDAWRGQTKPIPRAEKGVTVLPKGQLKSLIERLTQSDKGLIVVGPQTNPELAEAVTRLASRLGVPILADPLSQLRTGSHDKRNIIENYDSLLKAETIQQDVVPDYIVRFGAMPVSKAYLKWIQKYEEAIDHFVIDDQPGYREPSGVATTFIWSDAIELCNGLALNMSKGNKETPWLSKWKQMNVLAKNEMLRDSGEALNEGHAVVHLSEMLPDHSNFFIGNSMPIRDVDSFFMASPKEVQLLANRGANGIDGVVSTALGTASTGHRTILLLGDISFFHDLNGLWMAKNKQIPLTIVVINNDGGGIFSYLPQSNHPDHFEELFGTPLGLDLAPAIKMYGGKHTRVSTWEAYQKALEESFSNNELNVVEVITNREEHVDFHRQRWSKVEQAVLEWRKRQ
ncbi:2-succinyl-5-enolpyruvyl-6-hydroxy-3-cyclohexene-1-carboxylate synthase [Halobacillus karajensis]|uniref:2-succinyl-5-enolpyruvyl-6-hydroxy-3-cyclohexene-1-carboxylate synthase n=1 Tax=Halobacillus karajensis TaxID=195088 RepID=A0A024P8T8_9BACI|nr:2-succinyl-5-enolpyruvyl-6-hydroxy-3-cyclohexene-1-carboxylic-acid synthase [Halobacillus karajensis]CDQ21379.1 2-succinyl-5-enolpyruvyl-6-hydroxy-3-cyclohexene-1-carboxylate synthase [Halobacillus karajensis]CDQ25549.1 2-succinyl-5-enolpyruvyl-6-hydroxy-3-cyclohexene-1-carboxylate synthase [Halobacillus karajensis]CDQ25820.1 2-succinyl-5-enolpyruvyl-6-hydroxy-3-cyclohexene-1-carboxylate synthase [Halobacillus karajensis]SEI13767.1 2-succinyl-5-enolpyruvyl-6-hydroxy-3-cyclohexene-1-carboxyla